MSEMLEDPDLEDALNGLMNAVQYCDNRNLGNLPYEISCLYQNVAENAPASDWNEEWDDRPMKHIPIEELDFSFKDE